MKMLIVTEIVLTRREIGNFVLRCATVHLTCNTICCLITRLLVAVCYNSGSVSICYHHITKADKPVRAPTLENRRPFQRKHATHSKRVACFKCVHERPREHGLEVGVGDVVACKSTIQQIDARLAPYYVRFGLNRHHFTNYSVSIALRSNPPSQRLLSSIK